MSARPRAVVYRGQGGVEVIELREVDRPALGPHDVRIRVRACGLNRADILQRRGLYPAPVGVPADIPGLEFSGQIIERGADAGRFALDARVMGLVAGGAQCEEVVTHETSLMPIPDDATWEEAAAIPEVFVTAFDALFEQCGLSADQRLLITAVGSGVGTAAVQLARWVGATTFGTSRTPDKLKRARDLGLDHALLDAPDTAWANEVLEATGGRGVDVVLDFLGAGTLARHLKLLTTGGQLMTLGLLQGLKAPLNLGLVLRKRLTLRGSTLRSRSQDEKAQLIERFIQRALPAFASGALTPVLDTVYAAEDVVRAHQQLERNDTFGKLVLRWA